jgi:hypothetical protein
MTDSALMRLIPVMTATTLAGLLLAGCGKDAGATAQPQAASHHKGKPLHGGTPVVLGSDEYHLEFVLDPLSGRMEAYVMDGEFENFVRIEASSFEITAKLSDADRSLVFRAVANNATGEKAGDTAQFEAQADWLKGVTNFSAVLKDLNIRGSDYRQITFNFPKGNDAD